MAKETLWRAAAGVLDQLLSCLTPPRCRVCRAALFNHANPYLCADCVGKIKWLGEGACRRCGFPAGPYASAANSCGHCRGKRLRLTGAAAVARYANGARNMVVSLKFRKEIQLAEPMAALMAERLRLAAFAKPDALVPVRLHKNRLRERGFDQADLLCRHIAAMTGMRRESGMVEKVRHTPPQSSLDRRGRFDNIAGAFRASAALAGKTVVLVDDVMTTGATMRECAGACRQAGAKRVYALVFAR